MEEHEIKAYEEIGLRRMERTKRKKRRKRLLILAVIVILIAIIGNVFFGYDRAHGDKTVKIETGSSVFEIADTLKDHGVIFKKLKFVAEVLLTGNRGNLRFGTYEFKDGMTYSQIVKMIVTEGAKKDTVTVTIPEGFSVENIIDRLIELGISDEVSIKAALEADYEYEFIDKIPQKAGQKYKLQGFLFPSTYEFYKDVTPEMVIDTMLGEFEKQYLSAADNFDRVYEVITKAAMIEREAKVDSERATIAGVFENRIRTDMKLQIDATVAYAITDGKYDVERVFNKNLQVDSPYNTYKITGLPVGPIANPGLPSIRAALNPQKHDYLFYHTDTEKNDGTHIFTKTYEAHTQTIKN